MISKRLTPPTKTDILQIMKNLGQVAYEAYCENRGWKSFNGEPLPHWDNVKEDIRKSWEIAAKAVEQFCKIH